MEKNKERTCANFFTRSLSHLFICFYALRTLLDPTHSLPISPSRLCDTGGDGALGWQPRAHVGRFSIRHVRGLQSGVVVCFFIHHTTLSDILLLNSSYITELFCHFLIRIILNSVCFRHSNLYCVILIIYI